MSNDAAFTGSVPETYEECLVPSLFEPYSRAMTARIVERRPQSVLEVAAGTGALTRHLAAALPDARLVATDLNQAMLDVAASAMPLADIDYRAADAASLPYADADFDAVVAQFGVMFYPDRIAAHREALRLLAPGGQYWFAVWNSLAANPTALAVHEALQAALPEPRPAFMARVPYGHHDQARIDAELREAGFDDVAIEQVDLPFDSGTDRLLARGFCLGSPLAGELAEHPPQLRARALAAAEAAVDEAAKSGQSSMSALIVSACP